MLHQIDLDPPLHYGFYMEETQLNQRLRRVQCRCTCQTCDIQGNDLRIMHNFTDTARRIAQDDVNAFLTGTRPIPALRGPLRPCQIRIACSNEAFNDFN